MKVHLTTIFPFLVLAILLFQSCSKAPICEEEQIEWEAVPIYKYIDEIRIPPSFEAPQEVQKAGTIKTYQQFLFINEMRKGIHVYDNNDPKNPQKIGFIRIPGNLDFLIKDAILYANNYIDLVAIDIQQLPTIQLLQRETNVFPHDGKNDLGAYLVYYSIQEKTSLVDCTTVDETRSPSLAEKQVGNLAGFSIYDAKTSSKTSASFSRFTLINNHLYTIDLHHINLFDLSTNSHPTYIKTLPLDLNSASAETIFSNKNQLYIGTTNGMLIYDCSQPKEPNFVSWLAHASACDPLILQENYAYLSLNNNSGCNGWTNQVHLFDLQTRHTPSLTEAYPMDNPYGLCWYKNLLYVGEGEGGLKVFETQNGKLLSKKPLLHKTNITAYDVVLWETAAQEILLVLGNEGIYQLDINKDLALLSFMPL